MASALMLKWENAADGRRGNDISLQASSQTHNIQS